MPCTLNFVLNVKVSLIVPQRKGNGAVQNAALTSLKMKQRDLVMTISVMSRNELSSLYYLNMGCLIKI